MQQRVIACVQRLSADNPGKTILLVAHDGTINAVNAAFLKESIGIVDSSRNSHDFVAKFTISGGKITTFIAI